MEQQFLIKTINDIITIFKKILTKELPYASRSVIIEDGELLILVVENKNKEEFLIECSKCWEEQQKIIANVRVSSPIKIQPVVQ